MKNDDWHFDIDIDYRRQLAAIDELFENGGDENQTCKKLKIKPHVWKKWLEDETFLIEIKNRLAALKRHNNIMQASCQSFAMAKLLSLCSSEDEDICRKACAELLKLKPVPHDQMENSKLPEADVPFSQETASKMLALLAEDARNRRQNREQANQALPNK